MNEREVAELRRRLKPEKSAITHIHGCYVGEKKEVISTFTQSVGLMPQPEAEKVMGLLKKTLSGTLGRNLLDVCFATMQVADSEEHRRLMSLRNARVSEEEGRNDFYQQIIQSLELEGNYLILLAHDSYDVPYRSRDDVEQEDASAEVYSYIICAVCPVKPTKPVLSYFVRENEFHTLAPDWVVAQPEVGFLFPAFDDRSANIYNALYYSRDIGEIHPELIEGLFRTQPIMPAAQQETTFRSVLGDTLEEDCSLKVVQAVDDQLRELIETHKAGKAPENLTLSKGAVKSMLRGCGVEPRRVERFEQKYDDSFGADASITPRNVVNTKQIEIVTPDVTIKVSADRGDLVETRVIDGKKYILIRADDGAEVNGVAINIK